MVFYKIKHKPTGMFFKPSAHGSKVNLTKDGKAYQRRPSLKHVGSSYRHPIPRNQANRIGENWGCRSVIPAEWEIVEFSFADVEKKDARIDELERAMQWFVERCEKGEVRSRATYSRFKTLLEDRP